MLKPVSTASCFSGHGVISALLGADPFRTTQFAIGPCARRYCPEPCSVKAVFETGKPSDF